MKVIEDSEHGGWKVVDERGTAVKDGFWTEAAANAWADAYARQTGRTLRSLDEVRHQQATSTMKGMP